MGIAKNIKLTAALAGLAAFAVYLPALWGCFILSDASLILHGGGTPFMGLSLAVDRAVWGMSPMGFHFTNALFHAANSALVFALGYILLKRETPWPALLGALIFALHPANTEAVSWISARAELIYTMFFLLAFVSYLHYEKHGKTAGLCLSGVFFFLSMMGSEKALAFAALLPLYALIKRSRAGDIKKFAMAAALCALGLSGYYLFKPALPGARAFLAFKGSYTEMIPGLGYYAEKLLVPYNPCLFPPVPESLFYSLAGLLFVAAAVLLYSWKLRFEAFLVAWTIIALLPSFFVIDQSGSLLGERHLYISAAPFSILLASVLARINNRKLLLATALSVIAACALLTSQRVADWKDESSILAGALEKNAYSMYESPARASRVLTMLGVAEMETGDYEKAREHLLDAVWADEKNYMAYYQSGRLFSRLHDWTGEEGGVQGQMAVAREAAEVLEKGREHFRQYVYLHYELGIWQMRLFLWDDAEKSFRTVLKLGPQKEMSAGAADFLSLIDEVKKRGLWGYNAPGV